MQVCVLHVICLKLKVKVILPCDWATLLYVWDTLLYVSYNHEVSIESISKDGPGTPIYTIHYKKAKRTQTALIVSLLGHIFMILSWICVQQAQELADKLSWPPKPWCQKGPFVIIYYTEHAKAWLPECHSLAVLQLSMDSELVLMVICRWYTHTVYTVM